MLLHNSIVRCFVLPCNFDSRCSRILVARNIFQAVARINWRSLLFLHIQPRARVRRQQWQNTKDWYSKQPREELKQRRKTSLVTLCNTLAQFKSAEPSIDQVFLESEESKCSSEWNVCRVHFMLMMRLQEPSGDSTRLHLSHGSEKNIWSSIR